MDPALRQMIAADNAKQAREYYGIRDLIVVFSTDTSEKHLLDVVAALTGALRDVKNAFSPAITRTEITTKVMLEREVPADVVSPELGEYWYVVVTYAADGVSQRETVAAAFRERLRALAASGLNVSEISSETTEYKVLALVFGHPVE